MPMASVLERAVVRVWEALEEAQAQRPPAVRARSVGTVVHVGDGVARVTGLPKVKSGELLKLAGDVSALALDLDRGTINAVLLDRVDSLRAGALAEATGKVVQVPVGPGLVGRVVDAIGRPLDGGPPIVPAAHYPVEREATAIIERAPVSRPLQTGVKAVDALVPVGRGQRELILGDRQTGKTAIALDAVLNQRGSGVLCFYVVIGQRATAVAQLIATLRAHGAMEYTTVVAASGDEPAGMRYIAPYAATSMAEYFMERGRDVLIIYDDLTKHAESYRELSLVLRRPPAREAYPGDIFYAHARLLERSTQLSEERGGGSLTALPIAETQAEDISAYVPTNLISITDGQIYVSTELFQQGVRPAVDAGKSVSRVGGKSQIAAYRGVAAQLRLAYSQFEELEFFSRLGTRLDAVSEQIIRRGQRIREVLKQPPAAPVPVGEQVALLMVLNEGLLDDVPLAYIAEAEHIMRTMWRAELPKLLSGVVDEPWDAKEKEALLNVARRALAALPNSGVGGATAGSRGDARASGTAREQAEAEADAEADSAAGGDGR